MTSLGRSLGSIKAKVGTEGLALGRLRRFLGVHASGRNRRESGIGAVIGSRLNFDPQLPFPTAAGIGQSGGLRTQLHKYTNILIPDCDPLATAFFG